MRHNKQLDILRGISVLGVVLFHAKYPLVKGGYAGVDIFFVLSGYLISKTICNDLNKNNFSLIKFYLKRIRRILPAALFSLLIVKSFGYLVLFEEELKELNGAALSFLSLSTEKWAGNSFDYFGMPADYKPLIHYWSLSIELKFYIAVPIVLYIAFKINQKSIKELIALIGIGSFLLALYYEKKDPQMMYFNPCLRVWEFCLGMVVNFYGSILVNYKCRYLNKVVVASYALIIFCFVFFDEYSNFPGKKALIPCLAATLIISCGSNQSNESKLSDILLFVGKISFSLYLVHQSLFAFCRTILGRSTDMYETTILILASFVISIILYKSVEEPFQKNSNPLYLLLSIILFTVLLIVEIVPPNYMTKNDFNKFLKYRYDNNPNKSCIVSNRVIVPDQACVYKPVGEKQDRVFAFWGDSHMNQIFNPISNILTSLGYTTIELAIAGCPPITNTVSPTGIRKCAQNADAILKYLENSDFITDVILHSYWIGYLDNGLIASATSSTIAQSFEDVLRRLVKANKRIHIIYPVPVMKSNPPLTLARASLLGISNYFEPPKLSDQEYADQSRTARNFLDKATSNFKVNKIYIDKLLPKKNGEYLSFYDHILFYRDDNHLSLSGAKILAPVIVNKLVLQ